MSKGGDVDITMGDLFFHTNASCGNWLLIVSDRDDVALKTKRLLFAAMTLRSNKRSSISFLRKPRRNSYTIHTCLEGR